MPSLDSSHQFLFTLNGADVTFYVDPSSVQMTDAEGAEIDTLYFELTDEAGGLTVEKLMEVGWIIDPDDPAELALFGGLIVDASSATLPAGGLLWRVKCEGYGTLLARMETPERVYVQEYPGAIVADLLDRAGLTSQDSEQGALLIDVDGGVHYLADTQQDFSHWMTTSGDAAYAVVVTHSDGSSSWGFCGDLWQQKEEVTVFSDRGLTEAGWNGIDPATKTPVSYHVRRADVFSGSRPLDVVTHVTTGASRVLAFATTREESLAAALTRLAGDLGWVWRIDAQGYLWFGPASSDPAPFGVCDGANADYETMFPAAARSLTVQQSATEFFNRIVVRGGAKHSDVQTETFSGAQDVGGVFRLAQRNLIDITVKLNNVVVADGTLWWNTFGDRVVLVHYGEGWIWFDTPPLPDDEVECTYRYWEPLIYEQRDEASIVATRQTLTRTLVDSRIYDVETAAVRATALLAAAADAAVAGSFEVWRLGLRAGQQVALLFDAAGINGEYVVRKVDCRIGKSGDMLVCFVQFGGQQAKLSGVLDGWRWQAMDVRLGSLGEMVARATQALAKPATTSLALNRQDRVTLVDASGGDVVVTLPAAEIVQEQEFVVVRVDVSANDLNIEPASGETINGASKLSLSSQWERARLYSDGTQWVLV